MLARIKMWLGRFFRAKKLKIRFFRASKFETPDVITIDKKEHELFLPREHGVFVAFVELLLDDCYQLQDLESEDISTVLDIGANVGLFAVAAKSFLGDVKIHAYEPNRMLEKYLVSQAQNFAFDFYLEAVGGESGMVSLHERRPGESVHSVTGSRGSGEIVQISLGEAVKRIGGRVDLLKMDCEGAEWAMLERPEYFSGVRHLRLEYHLSDGRDHFTAYRLLEQIGFSVTDHQIAGTTYGLLSATKA